MRCSITLTIITAATLSIARPSLGTGDIIQHPPETLSLAARNFEGPTRLQVRSPEPGVSFSTDLKKQKGSQGSSLGMVLISSKDRRRPPIGEMTKLDKKATIDRLESQYGLKSMSLPPARRTQSTPEFALDGPAWSVMRSYPGPGHSSRVAAYEKADGQPLGNPNLRASSAGSTKRSQQSTSPAEAQVRYDVLKPEPGDPSYVSPSAFRASRVPNLSAISIPPRASPRKREHWSGFLDSDRQAPGCLGCFGFFR